MTPSATTPPPAVELLPATVPVLRRPLDLVDGHAYAALWPHARHPVTRWDPATHQHLPLDPPAFTTRQDLLLVRSDGRTFGPGGDHPLSELPLTPLLDLVLPGDRQWSPAALAAFRAAGVPSTPPLPALFERLADCFDHFIDFDRSLAPQRLMAEFCALYTLTTWLSPALSSLGYLWLSGDGDENQSRLFELFTRLGYLGVPATPHTHLPLLRDLSGYGSLLAFDLTTTGPHPARLDATLRAAALIGHRRSALQPARAFDSPSQRWQLRSAPVYCPRLFSAAGQPDPQLAALCIEVPLVRPGDDRRASLDLLHPAAWPHDPHALQDDLWAVSLTGLPAFAQYLTTAAASPPPTTAYPWRSLLLLAGWLQSQGAAGLFSRLRPIAESSQVPGPAANDLTTAVVAALVDRCNGLLKENDGGYPHIINISVHDVISALQLTLGFDSPISRSDLTPQRIGRLLKRLRLTPTMTRDRSAYARVWQVSAPDLRRLAFAYNVPLRPPTPRQPANQSLSPAPPSSP